MATMKNRMSFWCQISNKRLKCGLISQIEAIQILYIMQIIQHRIKLLPIRLMSSILVIPETGKT